MKAATLLSLLLLLPPAAPAAAQATLVDTPYDAPRVVFDFFLDDPAKMGSALYWIRSLILPLSTPPYEYDAETIKVVLHGTELVTVARKNEAKYQEVVERMRYYASLGIEFKVCGLALHDYGYTLADMQDFIQVVPSAPVELVYWQNRGYALVTPTILEKKFSIEQIR